MDASPTYLILAIDRHSEHIETIRTTLERGEIASNMVAIADPKSAIAYLNQQEPYQNASRPHLILLDIDDASDSDEISSLEVLKAVKTNPAVRQIPIIVLTMLDASDIVYQSYALQGNCYVLKPSNLDQLAATIKHIEEFWLGIVTLPR